MRSFGEQLSAARRAAGMTQEQLASEMHVARNTISNWERGERQPDVETLRRLGQLLSCDFLSGGEESRDDPQADEGVLQTLNEYEAPTSGENKRKAIIIGAAALALVTVLITLIILLGGKSSPEIKDENGNTYLVEDFQKTTPNEAGKAYVTIDTKTETLQGDNMTYWMYTFIMREDNGIDFHIDHLENVWLQRDSALLRAYTERDLEISYVGPDIPAHQKIEFTGGMPINQTNMLGVGLTLSGHDANGAELTFTAYIPFPSN